LSLKTVPVTFDAAVGCKHGGMNLGIFVLRQVLERPLEFCGNLIPFGGSTPTNDSLNDPTGIVFEDDLLDMTTDNGHEFGDVFLPLRTNVFLPGKTPYAFSVS
jgi:hypothetical protein